MLICKTTVVIKEPVEPSEFFQTRAGLFVHSDFRENVVSRACKLREGTELEFCYSSIGRNLGNREVKLLPDREPLISSEVCGLMGEMLQKQWYGGNGDLVVTEERLNLFFMSDGFITLGWDKSERKWVIIRWTNPDDVLGHFRAFYKLK